MIPGGNASELQIINAAHRLGLYVITSGSNKYAPAHQFSDEYVEADFSDREWMLTVAREKQIDYMCSNSNDIGLLSTAYVCEKLGLPGHDSYETTLKLHHKDRFKQLAKKLQLHVPEGESFADRAAAIDYAISRQYKVIIKPIDLVGGNGVSVADTKDAIISGIDKAFRDSLNKRIIIERFVEGTAHSLSTYIENQKVINYYSDNEYTLGKAFKISTSEGPATDFDLVRDILISDAEKVAEELKLVDGTLHMQYLMHDGRPYILEMTRRTCGDLYSVPESYALGFNTVDWKLRAECGMSIHDMPRTKQQGFYGRHCIVGPKCGITDGIVLDKELERCVLQKWLWGSYGFQINNCKNDILGLLFFKFESKEQAKSVVRNINQMIDVHYLESK